MNSKICLVIVGLIVIGILISPVNAQLQNSPWAKYHFDNQNHGLSPYPSTSNGTVEWNFTTGNEIHSAPTIDNNGTIYVGSNDNKLYAIYPNGTQKWSYTGTHNILTAPLIEVNGNVYIGEGTFGGGAASNFTKVNSSGGLVWTNRYGDSLTSWYFQPSFTIDGNVIVGSNRGHLTNIYPNGTAFWTRFSGFNNILFVGQVVGSNGMIYTTASGGGSATHMAIYNNNTVFWSSNLGCGASSTEGPTLSNDESIVYFNCDNSIKAVYTINGTEFWTFTGGNFQISAPAIDSSGNIYFGNFDGKYYILYPNGTQKSSYNTGSIILQMSPALDSNNIGYFGTLDGNVFAIYPNGTKKWNFTTGNQIYLSSPAIDSNGIVYIGSADTKLYAFNSSAPLPPVFDPSGFVNDSMGNPVSNAKVTLSNNTFTAVPGFSDSTGFWSTNIFADGTYNFRVEKPGYSTLTGSRAFAVGGINNNFTLTGTQAILSGHVFTNISGTGTTVIQGQLKDAFASSCGVAGQGGTLTIGTSGDGSTYVLKLIDVDSGNQQSVWQLLKDGTVLYDDQIVNTGTRLQLKIYENFYEVVNVDIDVSNVFQGSSNEFNTATTCGSFEHVSKTDSISGFLANLAKDITMGFVFGNIQSIQNLNGLFGDPSNLNAVHFNASAGHDAVLMSDFHVNNVATISNFNIAFKAASTTANAGKIEIAYTDNTQTQPNGFTDEVLINSLQSCQANGNGYCAPQHDFKSVDINGDGTIRVWVKLDNGFSDLNMFTINMNAWGTTSQIPLPGASVYSLNGSNVTTTDSNGFYSLLLSPINNTVIYTKVGFETKNYTFLFNTSNNSFTQDVVLNSTNATINSTKEYIIVPNFVQGTATNGNFKTLSHTSLIGGYQIAICPQLGTDCTIQDVPANTESTFALDPNLPIGTYQADLTGYLGGLLDISRETIVSTNFTVTSSTPRVDWLNGAGGYFLGDKMILSIYVPSSTANVNVTYLTNGTEIYSNTFSSTGTVQNVSFQTNSNISLTQFLPGTYQGCIEGGNCATVTLFNISNSDYQVSAPATVNFGDKFNIEWKSPHTALLQVTNQSNFIVASTDIGTSGVTGVLQFDTSVLPNKIDVLSIEIIRNSQIVANTTVNISSSQAQGGAPTAIGTNLLSFMGMPALWGLVLLAFVLWIAQPKNDKSPNHQGLVGFIFVNIEAVVGLWNPFMWYILIITWVFAAIYFTLGRRVTTQDG